MNTACPGRIKKDMCERKAYPHKVCPDGNGVRLRVNKIGNLPRHVSMLLLSDDSFLG